MKKVTILISHIPNPRILKRIKTLEKDFNISLIYWDRLQKGKETFEINPKHKVIKVDLKAPEGDAIKRILPFIRYLFISIRILKEEKPDIIHAANLDMLLIATTYKNLFNKDINIVYEVADLPRYSFYRRVDSIKSLIAKLLQKLEKKITKNISKIILTSPYFWEEYFSKFITAEKYIFVPNAPSKDLFNRYEIKNRESFVIGFIGSVRYIDQLKMLIDAVNELDLGIRVLIAGSGPGYKEISEYSKEMDFVEIYGPYNYEKEIVSLYEKIDCTYSVYDVELENVKIALPNRLYESIVCETPIIGAKGTVLGKFIEEKNIGITVKYDDKKELKNKILRLVESKKEIELYKANCRNIKENYYYENNSENLLKIYKQS